MTSTNTEPNPITTSHPGKGLIQRAKLHFLKSKKYYLGLLLVLPFCAVFAKYFKSTPTAAKNHVPLETIADGKSFVCNTTLYTVNFLADQGNLVINDCGVAEDDYDTYYGGSSPPLVNVVEVNAGTMLFVDVEGNNCLTGSPPNSEGDNSSFYQTVNINIAPACLVSLEAGFSFINISDFPAATPDLECQAGSGQDYLQFFYSTNGGSTFIPFDATIASAIELPSLAGCQTGTGSGTGVGHVISTTDISVPPSGNIMFRVNFGSQSVTEGIQIDFIRVIDRSPTINPIANASICQGDSYMLPFIGGTCLSGNEQLYTAPNGGGSPLAQGSMVSPAITTTYYAYDGTGTCSIEESFTITVTPTTTPALTPIGPYCSTGNSVSLSTTQSGINGNWSGPGVSSNNFAPATAGVGNHVLTFTPAPSQCANPNTLNVTVNATPTATNAALPAQCADGTGQATFNLSSVDGTVNGGTTNMVNWYSNSGATMAIPNPNAHTAASGFVYATVSNGPCTSPNIAQITLTVNLQPLAFTATVGACDQGGGMGTFDLTSVNLTVNGNTANSVTWFSDNMGMNGIITPNNYPSSPGTVYAQVSDGTCMADLVPVTLSVTAPPNANPAALEACDEGGNQATFDLTDADNDVSGGIGTVTYYFDAAATMLIGTPTSFMTISTTVFATVTVGTCTSGASPVTLTVSPVPVASPAAIQECVISGTQATFDLTSVNNTVNNNSGQPVNWYSDAAATMLIGSPTTYFTSSTTVFTTVINGNCESAPVAVTLTVDQIPNANDQTLSACDEGGNIATFDLTSAINAITGGQPSTVNFFEDINATIPINNPSTYNSITATVYGFVTGSNGCPGGPALIDLIINPLPSAVPTSIMECDEGGLAATFNLTDENDIVNGGSGNAVNWYLDAAGTSLIGNPSGFFTTTTTVFASVFDGNCEGQTVPVQLNVQENPMATATSLSACDEGAGQGTFDLTSLDIIVNGGTAAPVSWFLDPALNNPIIPPDAYVSGSTTVFAIVTAGGCSSAPTAVVLTVEAGNFANPASLSLCDEGGNLATFDLTSLNQTVNGNTGNQVNWYFDGGANSAINNPNTFVSGSTIVYATVISGACESATAEVTLGIIPAPTANSATLNECDEAGGVAFFNLTDADLTVNGGSGNPVSWYFDAGGNVPIANTTNFPSSDATVFASFSNGSCESDVVSVSLTVLPAPAAFSTQMNECDEGGNQANFDLRQADLIVNGGTATQVSWFLDDQGQFPVPNPNIFPSGPNTVYASVSNGTCASNPVPVDLIITPAPTANSASLSDCDDGTGLSIFDLTQVNPVVNGGTGVSVNWYADALGNIPINNPTSFNSGTATIFASTDNGVCESVPVAVNLSVTSPPEVTISIAMEISCSTFDDGAIELDINGNGPFTFDWNRDVLDGMEDPSNLPPGTYEVTVSDMNGCIETASVVLDEPTELFLNCSELSPILTENGNEGEIGLVFNGGTAPYTIEWVGPVSGMQTENFPGMISITGLTAGSYTITLTDDEGCQTMCEITLSPFACALDLEATTQVGPCGEAGSGMIDLTVNNGTAPYDFDWDDNTLDGQEDPSNLVSGTYTVTVTDANDCVDSLSIFVGQGIPLNLSCDELNPVSANGLSDGQAEIAFSGGMNPYTIAWSGPSSGSQTENTVGVYVINNLGAGDYILTITDDVGCTIECEFTINNADCNLDVTFTTNDITCPGDSDGSIDLTITGTTPFTIDWDDDIYDGMEDLSNLTSGLYFVQVTDADGCSDNLSIPVNQPGNILITCSVTSTVTTPGGSDGTASISYMGGTGPFTISWNGPVSGSQVENDPGNLALTNLTAGNYIVTLVDANNCMGTCSFFMNEPPCGIFLDIFGQNPPCDPVNFGFIDLSIMGGQGPLTIDWNEDIYDGMEDLFGVEAGTYTVTVSDTTGCVATTSITLSLPPGVEVDAQQFNAASFGGSDGQAEITFTGGTGPYNIFWLGPVIGNTIEQTGGTIIISDLPAGTYDIIVSDANFCEGTNTFNITETNCSFAIIDTIQHVTCFGEDDGGISLTINGTDPPYDFDWEDDALDGMDTVGGLAPGEYTVTIMDNANCTEEFSFIITEPEVLDLLCDQLNPVSMAGADDGEATITFSGGTSPYTLEWTGPMSGNQTELAAGTITIANLAPGNYNLMLTDTNMCTLSCMFTITAPICDFFLEIDGEDISCNGRNDGSIELDINGGSMPFDIRWSDSTLDGMEEGNDLSGGTYTVTVMDGLGCRDSISITLEEPALLEIACSELSPVSIQGGNDGIVEIELLGGTPSYTFDLTGPVNTSFTQNAPGTYQFANLPAGDYMILLTDGNNCTAECSFTITEPDCPLNLEISGTNLSCFGSADGTIDLVINNGVLPFNINWNVDMMDGQADHMGLAAGAYSVTLTDGQSCVDTISIEITQPDALDITCSEETPVSTSGGNDGEASIEFSGGTAPYTLTWNGTVNGTQVETIAGTVIIGDLEAGSYVLTIVDDNGCEIGCSFTITDPDCALNLMLESNDTSCPGSSDGSIDLTILNATGVPDIDWDDNTLDGTEDPSGLMAGTYNVTVTDLLGCVATGSVIVDDGNQIPGAEASSGGVVCLGDCFTFDVDLSGQAPFVLEYEVVSTNGSPIPLTLNSDTEMGTITICPAIFGLSAGTLDVNFLEITDAICQTNLTQSEQLELVESSTGSFEPTLCPEESIDFNGVTYDINNPTGMETLVDANQHGCDSIVEINLNFFPEAVGTLQNQLCPGGTLLVNGTVYDENNPSGVETLTGASSNGCDSTLNVELTFFEVAMGTLNLILCPGQDIVFNGSTYDVNNPNGTEILTGAASTGCDSIVEINLAFFEPATGDFTTTICEGENIVFNGTTYDQANPSGTETLVGASSNGCDSIVQVNINFFEPATGDFTTTICEGENIVFNGTTYDQANPSGTETLVGASSNGCDSIVQVNLNFFEPATGDFTTTICEGENIVFNGTTYDQSNPSGTETLVGASSNGCDSTVQVNLNFFEPATGDFTTTICEGENIVFNGTTYDQANPSGTETLVGASSNGCDSIVQVNLNFFEPATSEFTTTLCEGENIVFNGTTYDQTNPSGTETLVGASSNGCDSTVQVNLNFFEPATSEFTTTLCEGENIVFNGTTYDQANPSGTETLVGASSNGCDSTVQVNINFFEPATGDFTTTLCEGENIVFNGTTYDQANPSGTETLVGASSNGCDSIVEVSLNFFEPAMGNFMPTICEGESIVFNGTTYDQSNPSGTETLTGASVFGCDSTVNVSLNIVENVSALIDLVLCPGEAVEVNGQLYDENNPNGMETIVGGSILGCDSVITIDLQYLEEFETAVDDILCFGESLSINGTEYNQNNPSGTEVLLATNGCDSTINIDLSFYEEATSLVEMVLCDGESLDVNGTVYNVDNPSGTEIIPNGSILGCDSTIQVNLSFNAAIMGAMVSSGPICAGESASITFELSGADTYEVGFYTNDINNPTVLTGISNGHSISVDPAFTTIYTFSYIAGLTNTGLLCEVDTGVGVTLEVSDLDLEALVTSDYNGFNVSCTGATDGSVGATAINGIAPFDFEWSTGASTSEVFDLSPGTYGVTITDATGCSTQASVEVVDSPGISVESTAIAPDCFDVNAGSLIIGNLNGGIGPFEYSLDGEFFRIIPDNLPHTIPNIAPGNYTLLVQDVNDCQGTQVVNVPEAEELTLALQEVATIQLGDSILLNPVANFDIAEVKWTPDTSLFTPESAQTLAKPFETIHYQLTAFDSLGCSASTSITIIVQKDDRVYIPNVFSPNGDGDNDSFMIFSDNNVVEVTQFRIFDRWGNLLFEEGPFAPNVPQFGWDGTYRGQKMNSGVYVFFAEILFVDGRTEMFKGDVLLMR